MLDTGYDKNKEDLVLDTGYDKDMEDLVMDTVDDKDKEDLVLYTGYDKDMEYRVLETHSEPPRVLHTQWRMTSNIMCVTYTMANDKEYHVCYIHNGE